MNKRIENLQKRLNETIDAMDSLNERAESEERAFTDEETEQYKQLETDAANIQADLKREKDLEQLKAKRAKEHEEGKKENPRIPRAKGDHGKERIKCQLLVDIAKAKYHGGNNPFSQLQYAEAKGMNEARAVLKAVTETADSVTAGWAAELVQQEYSDFIELLRGRSIYARTPSRRALLGRNGSLLFPGLATDASGDFVGEGQPIPVVQGLFEIQEAKPYKLGVLTVQTAELMRRSDPSSDAEIRDSMVQGTAVTLDAKFTDNNAMVPGVRPAGLQTYCSSPTASAGSDQAGIDTDLSTASGKMITRNMNEGLIWMLHPNRINGLRYKRDANGNYIYRDEINNGTLGGFPFQDSTRQPADIVMLLHTDSLYKLIEGSVEIETSMDATLHMNTNPEQIVGGGGVPSIPAEGNVRSMFQEDSVATRLIMPASWHVVRTDAVEVITGVAW